MSTDTPIFDQDAREEVAHLAASFDIADRFRKTLRFRTYLEAQWNLASIGASYYDLSALLAQQEESFSAVKQAIERASEANRRRGAHYTRNVKPGIGRPR
jgi:hypothetical protein